MADKAIYSVDTINSMLDTDKVYVNTGNNIKQITKDNLCGNDINNNTNAISAINSSMTDYGLNNVFDGRLLAGNYDIYNSGSFISIYASHMSSKNYISCKEGDIIKIKYGKVVTNQMHFTFFKADGTYISSSVSGQVSEFSAIAPSGCSKFMFTVIDTTENHNTIDTCYPISVYVNNQIDVVMNDKVSNVTYTGNSLDYSSDLNSITDSRLTTYWGWTGSGGLGQPTEKVTGLFMSVNMGDSVLQIIRGVDEDTKGYMRFYSVKTNKWTNWK